MSDFPTVEQLIKLAQNDPDQLERIRQREITALIDGAPVDMKRRLRGLQFQIDCTRKLHKNPMGACIAISSMMMGSLHKLNQALHGIDDGKTEACSATIHAFPAAAKHKPLHIH